MPPPPPPAPAALVTDAHAPEPVRVIMLRSVEMGEAEEVQARAMVATNTGTRLRVSTDEIADALYNNIKLVDIDFTVHTHHSEDFLILISSKATKDSLSGDHFIRIPRFTLLIHPWCKLAHAGVGGLEDHVELELRDIPTQEIGRAHV